MNNTGRARACYTSPRAKVVEINVQGVLCGSGNENSYEKDYGDGGFALQE